MKQDDSKVVRMARTDEMEKFIKTRAYTFMPTTHDMTRVVKCVFGVDRRRVSAYSIALREALRQKVAAADLVAFIEQNGGVEQIRLGGTKPLTVAIRAAKALMASPNSPTRGHPKFPQAAQPNYDVSGLMAKRAAASLSL
jgi:hypothetical protein